MAKLNTTIYNIALPNYSFPPFSRKLGDSQSLRFCLLQLHDLQSGFIRAMIARHVFLSLVFVFQLAPVKLVVSFLVDDTACSRQARSVMSFGLRTWYATLSGVVC
jgi:hypothetical protein